MLILGILGVIVSGIIMIYSIYAQKHYPTVEGTIVNVVFHRKSYSCVTQYYVNGKLYQAYTSLYEFSGYKHKDIIGKKVIIHYNPKDPSKIVGHHNGPIIGFIIFVLILVVYILVEGV